MIPTMTHLSINSIDIHPNLTLQIKNAGITKVSELIILPSADLRKKAKLTESQLDNIKDQAAKVIYPIKAQTAFDRWKVCTDRIPTGCESIDKLLQGGILCQGLTEVTGESATGKTQICMQLSLTSQLLKRDGQLCKSLYICTEDTFPTQRLLQLQEAMRKKYPSLCSHKFTNHVYVEHIADKNQLLATIENRIPALLDRGQTNLVIIDSVTAVFRGQEVCQTMMSRSKDIASIGLSLHKLAEKYKICVVCVNQVTADMKSDSLEKSQPALGLTWSNLVTTRLQVKRANSESPMRVISVTFAPHLPSDYCAYTVTKEGVVSFLM